MRILVYEPLSANDPASVAALGRGTRAHQDMLAAGRDMRDAMAGDLAALQDVDVTVTVARRDASPQWPGPRVRAITPRPREAAVDFVRRQAASHDRCWVVAPESRGLLHALCLAGGEARWIGCSADAIQVAASKHATCATLARAGIVTPLAFADDPATPWIVKPDDGAGTLDTRRFATRSAAEQDLQRREHAGQSAVMEPFVAGEALSLSLVVGPLLADTVAFNRQHVRVDAAGWLHDLGVQPAALHATDPRAPALRALAGEVAAALPGLRGYVGLDVVWNERKGPVLIEVNPRVTCAYVGLSALLHRNLAADILAAHALAEHGLA